MSENVCVCVCVCACVRVCVRAYGSCNLKFPWAGVFIAGFGEACNCGVLEYVYVCELLCERQSAAVIHTFGTQQG